MKSAERIMQETLPAEPPPGYVRVRVAVAVDAASQWMAYGHWDELDCEIITRAEYRAGDTLVWLVADVPIPKNPTITATVVSGEANP